MNYLRQKVSGKKKRLQEGDYDLDLTYITPRIIAMSLPGEGFQGIYRNPIEKVSDYLNSKHQENYFIFNLSGKSYDESKFKGQIFKGYQWKDHHSPPLNMLFDICLQIHNILKSQEEKNVIVVHCLAGKGRTGTIICCYLLYCGKFQSVQDAMYYYGKKRFNQDGLGVNQPCQIKYIEYFYQLLTLKTNIFPTVLNIKSIHFYGHSPNFNMDGLCKPYIEIINVQNDQLQFSSEREVQKYKGNQHQIVLNHLIFVYGDVLIKVYNHGTLKNSKMFRLAFNTSFIDQSNKIIFSLKDLDPSEIIDDQRFTQDFQVIIEFERCSICGNNRKFSQICNNCEPFLNKSENEWNRITEIIKRYQKPTEEQANYLLFLKKENDDVEFVLSTENQIRSNTLIFESNDSLLQQE